MNIKRGDIYYADLSPVVGSEQGGIRPVLIIQNDVGNRYSPTVIAAAITSKTDKTKLPPIFRSKHMTAGWSATASSCSSRCVHWTNAASERKRAPSTIVR